MSHPTWFFFRIALLVTGKGEGQFLPRLFRSLEAEGHCSFEVGRWIRQLRPKASNKPLKGVGKGHQLPKGDEAIGLAARGYLRNGYHYVILVDDLAHDFRDQADAVFQRYRVALDTILGPAGLSSRASVHFLVNMLEAYYFAHADAINAVLGTQLADFAGDVETIRHPKNELKKLHPGFDEIEHGRAIIECLDVAHVLSNPATCRSLRTLFGWCSKAIGRDVDDVYQLASGSYYPGG
jgi:hypothetical protein